MSEMSYKKYTTEETSGQIGAHEILGNELNLMHERIARLEQILAPVLIPSTPSIGPNSDQAPNANNSPLRDYIEQLISFNIKLDELYGRIDL